MKIVVLDRDGVINQDSDHYIKSADEWMPENGSLEAIKKLKKNGWTVAVATNQSGIKRGLYSRKTLSMMHKKMNELLGNDSVDWVSFSPYLDVDNSVCRKPNSGLLRAIEQRFDTSLKGKVMIGDTVSDLKAAKALGMKFLLVKTGKGERSIASLGEQAKKIPIYENLLAAVESVL